MERIANALRQARATLSGTREDEHHPVVAPVISAIERAESRLAGTPEDATLDATERGRLERRVRELERELEAHTAFLSTVGHELRNPLSPIYMQAQYLLDFARQSQGGSISADWLIERLESFSDRLRKFVGTLNRIMDASRVSAGQLDLELETVDLSEVIREVAAGFERELHTARSTLKLELPEHVTGTWDRLRLEQIVTNLISNAIRYGAGKPIAVGLALDEDRARLEVVDHGIGIAPEDQRRIFRRFERVTRRSSTGGFGIGLWIVQESCRAMAGSVEVQSTPGQGSRFIVKLPRETTSK
jgi:signal transduction histidine kinase